MERGNKNSLIAVTLFLIVGLVAGLISLFDFLVTKSGSWIPAAVSSFLGIMNWLYFAGHTPLFRTWRRNSETTYGPTTVWYSLISSILPLVFAIGLLGFSIIQNIST